MAERTLRAILLITIVVPLLVSTMILVIVVMVLPNSPSQGEEKQIAQSAGNTKSGQELAGSSLSSGSRSHILFIFGIIFASSLFVFLVVYIVLVCLWARKSKSYTVKESALGDATHQRYYGQDSQLTKDHAGKVFDTNNIKDPIDVKKGHLNAVTLAAFPSPPVKTVAVTTQVAAKESTAECEECSPNFDNVIGVETCPAVQPKNYGTLGRTHLMSTVDEDGYYIDNLGFESEQEDTEGISTLENPWSPTPVYEDGLPEIGNNSDKGTNADLKGQVSEGISAPETESIDQSKEIEKQLSKQDSFQGLPPFESFDKYLTLVRLDSSTSLGSYTLEDTKVWESIEEEVDEHREVTSTSHKKE